MTGEPVPRTIDVQAFIDAHGLSPMQRRLIGLCFLVVAFDGFDTAIIGFIGPAVRAAWSLDVAELGPLFAAGLFGLMIGAFVVGPLADRFGRTRMLVISLACFGGASLVSAMSPDITSLIVWRGLTGLGLGGAMPTAVTLTAEYSPQSRRSFLVTLMFCGFTIGSAVGGLAAARVVAEYGWRPLLVAGGVAPLALVPVLVWVLPESVRYLVAAHHRRHRVPAILRRIVPDPALETATFVDAGTRMRSPVRELFGAGERAGTLLLWLAFFNSLLVVYLLLNWTPTLVQRSGMSLSRASLITAMFQVGGTVGAVALGWVMDRFSPHVVLGTTYLIGAAFVSLIGVAAGVPVLMAAAVFGAGFCVSGGQVGANALAAAFYPTSCRATGVSWALGAGRSGSIVGSIVGGVMLTQGWSLSIIYSLVGVAAALSGLAILMLGRHRHASA